MPREIVSVHVGQCGLQMGMAFWSAALAEQLAYQHTQPQLHQQHHSRPSDHLPPAPHSALHRRGAASDAMSTFFSPSPSSPGSPGRARAVLVDMECGVLSAIERHAELAPLFDSSSACIRDVSGSGNNFAVGYLQYGPQYRWAIVDAVQRQVEDCDSLQSFLISHSTGGGTGSGLGAAILEALRDEYPDVYLVDQCVLPSTTDDVVTSPYNAALSVAAVTQHADVVIPFDNEALAMLVPDTHAQPSAQKRPVGGAASGGGSGRTQSRRPPSPSPSSASSSSLASSAAAAVPLGGGFAALNALCGEVLSSLTCGMRFPGELNVDWNELMQNLCPFTHTNILIPAMAPITQPQQQRTHSATQSSSSSAPAASAPPATSASPSVPPNSLASAAVTRRAKLGGADPAAVTVAGESPYLFHTLAMAQRLQAAASSPFAAPSTLLFPVSHSNSLGSSRPRTAAAMEDALFASALSRRHQLIHLDPLSGTYLSAALLCRGALTLGSLQRQVALWSPQMSFAALGAEEEEGQGGLDGRSHWKLGLCSVPSLTAGATVLALSNNSAIATRLLSLHRTCTSLFQRRAHFHHYSDCGMEETNIHQALQRITDVADAYTALDRPHSRKQHSSSSARHSQPATHSQQRARDSTARGGGR